MTTAPAPSVPIRPGEVIAGKYRVDRVLGAGGMGFVVAATNVDLAKAVALKMMLPAALQSPTAVERFEREARAAVRLKSEHVAEVLDIGRLPSGLPFIVMELLEGADLDQVVRTSGALPVEVVVEYVRQACEAIGEAHAAGIVHRDLKLRNLFLARRLDGSPVVKVLDFGVSKWAGGELESHALTRTTEVMGSPFYMSPEQVRSSKDVDARTDIWSLGVVIFELLTGRVPFLADTLPALCALVLEQPAPSVSSLRPGIPSELVAIVARCLEKAPERRFQSVGELVAALEPLRAGGARGSFPALPTLSPAAGTLRMGPVVAARTDPSLSGTELAVVRGGRQPALVIALIVVLGLLGLLSVGALAFSRWRATPHAAADAAAASAPLPPLESADSAASADSARLPPPPPPEPPPSTAPEATPSSTHRGPLVLPVPPPPRPRPSTHPSAAPSAPQSDPFSPPDRK